MHELNANMSIQVKGKHSNITVLKNCHKQASLVKRKPVFHKKMAFFSFFKKKGGGLKHSHKGGSLVLLRVLPTPGVAGKA